MCALERTDVSDVAWQIGVEAVRRQVRLSGYQDERHVVAELLRPTPDRVVRLPERRVIREAKR